MPSLTSIASKFGKIYELYDYQHYSASVSANGETCLIMCDVGTRRHPAFL